MKTIKTNHSPIRNHWRTAQLYGLGLTALSPALLPSISYAQENIAQSSTKHTFVFKAEGELQSVAVAGAFNGWSTNATQLKVDADGRTWRVTLPLDYGLHQYKFVLNGNNWITDPKATKNETDASGNTNSVLFLAPLDYANPAKPNDGETATSALLHQMHAPYLNYDRGKLALSLRVRPNDLSKIQLRSGGKLYPMKMVNQNDLYATYRGELVWSGKTDLTYNFVLNDGSKVHDFGSKGLDVKNQPYRIVAKTFKPYVVPDWVERTVFYQIFPDRFANGDKTNDPKDVQAWDAKPEWFNRFGGDIAGVRQHMPYLKELGISGVYFNPIFKSPSNHRYDAQDFRQIDPEFGTNAQFAALTKDLQKQGIRTVMDFVFNHTATNFGPFADIREKGEASKYKDWFFIKSYPVKVAEPPNYVAWYNYPSMPKLNLMNPETGDYMLNLVNYWKKEVPLAGLRLDVADEVDVRFWRRLRTRVKGLDPQTWIVGERWGDASQWLQGDQWDASMNYPFLFANVDFFAEGKSTATGFTKHLMENYNAYPPQVSRNMMNLLSSHDRPRFITVANNNAALHRLAATVQFTWVGAPSIYYGEELGMQGGADPDNRRGMDWKLANPQNQMLSFYKRLIQVRNSNRALQSGDPAILLVNDDKKFFAYSRTLNDQMAVIAINRSDSAQTLEIPLTQNAALAKIRTKGMTDALSGKTYKLVNTNKIKVELAPLSSVILQAS